MVRLTGPLARLADEIEAYWAIEWENDVPVTRVGPKDLVGMDLFIFTRMFAHPYTQPLIEQIMDSGKPTIYETDDLLTDLPSDRPSHSVYAPYRDLLCELISRCSAVMVSTEELRKAYLRYNRNIYILPNLLNEKRWFVDSPAQERGMENRVITIGYAGSPSHRDDLALVEEALGQIADKWKERVTFKFLGCAPPKFRRCTNVVVHDAFVGYGKYPSALGSLGLDIGIAPLVDNPFNRCKSNQKWLEYSACGIAGVYSDLPPYSNSVVNGRTGILVANTTEAWFQAIDSLVANKQGRTAMAKAAYDEVRKRFTFGAGIQQYLDVYRKLAANRA